jgi:hypothetical protein
VRTTVPLVVLLRLGLPYSSLPCTTHGLLTYQHTRFCLFHFCSFHQSFFFFSSSNKQNKISLPQSLVTLHFVTLYPTLHLPDFLQPTCFSACLLLFVREPLSLRNCPCQFARVSWTEGVLCSVCYSSKREGRQVSKHKALSTIHETRNKHWALEKDLARIEPPGLVLPPFTPPLFHRCGRDHKPNGLFTLVVWFLCIPPTTWAPCTAVDVKESPEPCC